MALFFLILLLLLLMGIFYFTYRKACEHLEILKVTDARFYDIDDVGDLLHKSKGDFYFYFIFLYVNSPFYFPGTIRDEHQAMHKNVRKFALMAWYCIALLALSFLGDYLFQLTQASR
jgi:hypothetical protein